MSYTDSELRSMALQMWANHIETGNVTLSATDLSARNASQPVRDRITPPSLSQPPHG